MVYRSVCVLTHAHATAVSGARPLSVSFWRALGPFLLGRQLYGLSALPPAPTQHTHTKALSPGRCVVKAAVFQTFEKIALMSKPDHLDPGCTWKAVEELQGKTFWGGNILSLYHEGSRLSVDTFGVAARTVCPEADVVFPCTACVCACAHAHAQPYDSYFVCGSGLKTHPTQSWYIRALLGFFLNRPKTKRSILFIWAF